MRIYLQNVDQAAHAPRFCHLILQRDLLGGWNLVREAGYQGYSGRVRRDHYDHWEEAELALIKVRDSHVKRGYRVVFAEGQGGPDDTRQTVRQGVR